jgi:conjugal transfer pilus assembly protein TraV
MIPGPFRCTTLALPLILALSLGGCMHFGSNVAGQFRCEKGDCQPVSEVDARATRDITGTEEQALADLRQRIGITAGDTARTGERTLRVVLPAHIDQAGVLHEESAVWAVVEAPQWASALRTSEQDKSDGSIRAIRKALKNAARRAHSEQAKTSSAPQDAETSLFIPASPHVLPSQADEAGSGPRAPIAGEPVAEGSDVLSTQHDWTPRPEGEALVFPSPAAIDAAKARSAPPAKQEPPQPQTTKGKQP